MQRITITLDDELLTALDRIIAECSYQNRSEAIRDLTSAGISQLSGDADDSSGRCGALASVYDHRERELARRRTGSFHERHYLSVASMHVHLEHESCLEVAVLRGVTRDVRDFAWQIVAERGVRHGRLATVPIEFDN
jgi:CopG family nickel-responsive transcriptional regulator